MDAHNTNTKTKFADWFRGEVFATAALVGVLMSIFNYFATPLNKVTTDQALMNQTLTEIKTNHLKHIEDAITERKDKDNSQDTQIAELNANIVEENQKLERITTLLEVMSKRQGITN